MTRRPWSVAATALIAALAASANADGVYKWVDDQGRTHFSDAPPDGAKTRKLDMPPAADPVPGSQGRSWQEQQRLSNERRYVASQKDQASAKQQQEADNRCLRARQNLDVLNRQRPVYHINTRGEREYVDDNERQANIAAANQQVATDCR